MMIQGSIVPRVEQLAEGVTGRGRREPSQLPPSMCPSLQRGDGCDPDPQPT